MRNGMGVWGAVVGAAVLAAACGGKSGTSGSTSEGVPPSPPAAPVQHFLTISKSGSGSVRSTPAGIDCGTTCSAILAEGTQMVLIPVPDPGWQFAGWGGGCSGLGGCALRIASDTKVFVTFVSVAPAAAGKHNVTVTPSGAGAGRISSSPAGIDCGASCSAQFDDGTKVTFTVAPAQGSTFAGWSGACAGTATTCELSITADLAIGAAFDGASSAPPASAWVAPVSDATLGDVVSMARDGAGNTVALIYGQSAPHPVGLRKLDPAGKEVWSKAFEGVYGGRTVAGVSMDTASAVATDSAGDIYLLWASNCADVGCTGTIDFGDGPTAAAALVTFDPDGKLIWEKRLAEDANSLRVDSKGDVVFLSWHMPGTTSAIVKVSSDGADVWKSSSPGIVGVRIDPAGNAIVACLASAQDPSIFGQSFSSEGPVFAKLGSGDGALQWAKRIGEGAKTLVPEFRADASGAIAAATPISGAFDFGGQHFDTSADPAATMMLVFGPDGSEHLGWALPDAPLGISLAVDPAGKILAAVRQTRQTTTLLTYDLTGTKLASQDLQATGDGALLNVKSIAVDAAHGTELAGNFTGTVDFGSGPITSQSQQGFVANLGK